MYLLYNTVLSPEEGFSVDAADRAFQYGDGLFETLRYENGRILFWPDHFDRLTRGMAALKLGVPEAFTADSLPDKLLMLLSHNELAYKTARIKIQVWRQSGGLYTPTSRSANVLITARPGQPFGVSDKEQLGIYDDVRLGYSTVSAYKTTNALPYILAGLARQDRGYDDMILTDTNGHLAECIAAALFWLRHDTLYMPSLETGCIDGILRRQLIRLAPGAGFRVQEGLFFPDELAQADAVFCGNVMGIQRFQRVNGIDTGKKKLLDHIKEQKLTALFSQLV